MRWTQQGFVCLVRGLRWTGWNAQGWQPSKCAFFPWFVENSAGLGVRSLL